MPTEKKRINLTLPDEIYSRLQVYRSKYGIASDAGACLQLIVRQLDSIETGERMMQMVSRFTEEELQQFSRNHFAESSAAMTQGREVWKAFVEEYRAKEK